MFLVIFLIKLDLVTGFLGSGKTTFIKDYVKYLKSIGESVCVIVNDHGGVNVDNLFLSNIVDTESIVSDTDPNTTYRRYKTKLIACMLKHYTRVVIEPSGVFDTDSFFDLAYEDTICNNYTISNIFAIMEENYIKDNGTIEVQIEDDWVEENLNINNENKKEEEPEKIMDLDLENEEEKRIKNEAKNN